MFLYIKQSWRLKISVLTCVLISLHRTEPEEKCNTFKCSAASSSRPKSTRIVGGTDALPNEFPHQVYFKRPQPPPIFCGGTVLTEKYVVSAAHCYLTETKTGFSVVAGAHDVKVPSGREQERQLKKVTLHEYYDQYTKFNDIAVIEVYPPFDQNHLNDIVQPVVLPQSAYVATGDFVVTGWGIFAYGVPQPDILQKVTLPVLTYAECYKSHNGLYMTPTKLCAGYLGVGGKDACQGDSGGPLARKMANGSYLLAGIVSYSAGCADPRYMGHGCLYKGCKILGLDSQSHS